MYLFMFCDRIKDGYSWYISALVHSVILDVLQNWPQLQYIVAVEQESASQAAIVKVLQKKRLCYVYIFHALSLFELAFYKFSFWSSDTSLFIYFVAAFYIFFFSFSFNANICLEYMFPL